MQCRTAQKYTSNGRNLPRRVATDGQHNNRSNSSSHDSDVLHYNSIAAVDEGERTGDGDGDGMVKGEVMSEGEVVVAAWKQSKRKPSFRLWEREAGL